MMYVTFLAPTPDYRIPECKYTLIDGDQDDGEWSDLVLFIMKFEE